MKQYIVVMVFILFFQNSCAHKNLPLHQIIELDEMAYLVSMIQSDDNKISYRTYPFKPIVNPGFYKLANQVTNQITINSNDVILDLGGQNAAGGIVVEAGLENITIKNGTVDVAHAVTNAVEIKTGCSNLILQDLNIKNGTTNNIFMSGVFESTISNCDISGSVTGIALGSCSNLLIENCNAICNTEEGFCLVNTSSCVIKNCKAISTGQGNTATTKDIFGFVSDSGHGNTFEGCIANSTQGLSITDYLSIIAGFAFKGTEQCSKIVGCKVSNTTSSPSGNTLPYGIYLETSFPEINPSPAPDFLITLTGVPEIPKIEARIRRLAWSPDGNYLAFCGDFTERIAIYHFDRSNIILTRVATPDSIPSAAIESIDWSPDGNYLAAGAASGTNELRIYQFNTTQSTLIEVASADTTFSLVKTVDWRFDGKYLAVADSSGSNLRLDLYEFDRINYTLTFRDGISGLSTNGFTEQIMCWEPSGSFIYLTMNGQGVSNNEIRVFAFNESEKSILQIQSLDVSEQFMESFDCSPNGKYMAAVRSQVNTTIIEYDKNTNTLMEIAKITPSSNGFAAVRWSPDGRYIAQTINTTNNLTQVYAFNDPTSGSDTLTLLAEQNSTKSGSGLIAPTLAWSPDGRYLAQARVTSTGPDISTFQMYETLVFPANNVIKNNTVYCNSGSKFPSGIGISGSNIDNLIIGNTCYANPINPEFLELNYTFCTNVFNPLFQDYPSPLQNIGPMAHVPIEAPADQVLMLTQLNNKLCDIQANIDLLIAANE